jgi:hypothetical protein
MCIIVHFLTQIVLILSRKDENASVMYGYFKVTQKHWDELMTEQLNIGQDCHTFNTD